MKDPYATIAVVSLFISLIISVGLIVFAIIISRLPGIRKLATDYATVKDQLTAREAMYTTLPKSQSSAERFHILTEALDHFYHAKAAEKSILTIAYAILTNLDDKKISRYAPSFTKLEQVGDLALASMGVGKLTPEPFSFTAFRNALGTMGLGDNSRYGINHPCYRMTFSYDVGAGAHTLKIHFMIFQDGKVLYVVEHLVAGQCAHISSGLVAEADHVSAEYHHILALLKQEQVDVPFHGLD